MEEHDFGTLPVNQLLRQNFYLEQAILGEEMSDKRPKFKSSYRIKKDEFKNGMKQFFQQFPVTMSHINNNSNFQPPDDWKPSLNNILWDDDWTNVITTIHPPVHPDKQKVKKAQKSKSTH